MHVSPSSSPRMAKSTSLGVLDHDHADMHIVEQEDIIGLTQDVKNFSDNLARLKALFTEPWEIDEDLKVLAHERLGEVLCTLKSVLQRYPPLNTTELFSAAGTLISKIKNYSYDDHNCDGVESAFNDAIDQLALEFSSSVSEYLMGDLQHSFSEDVKTKSYDNLLSMSSGENEGTEDEKEEPVVRLTSEEIDGTLMKLQAGLELAFQRAKAWSKYLKDVMAYIERRAQLEVEYAKNLSRLASSVKPVLTEEGFLPLQSVYCTVLSQDVEYSKTCQATFTLLQTSKFIEPLTGRRNEYDKVRKTVKDTWNKEVKKMQESVNNLRKAQTLYVTRKQEYAKARELAAKTETDMLSHSASTGSITTKMDKKKRAEDDALHKAAEAETTYKACVAEANSRQTDIQKTKNELLAMLREQILFSDQAIKKATIEYFQLLQTVSAPVPVQYNTLCESTKRYEPGSQYGEFVRRLPITTFETLQYEEFKFEPYSYKIDPGVRKPSTQSIDSASSDHQSGEGSPSPRRSDSHSGSSKSVDSSPSASPYPAPGNKRLALSSSMDDLIEDNRDMPSGVKQLLAVPGTEQMDVNSLVKRQGQRRGTTFGVDFQEQVEHYHSAIPPIISKCLKEVEKRGINVKGIYRVSGVKSTVESLCQRFEMDPESVTLDTENPNVISNVLKLYLRQLPEPLLTFRLYQNFIQVAKENMSGGLDMDHTVEHFHELIDRLPFSNRKTCGSGLPCGI
ncbi:RHG29-like protein [Mya arenaria]|uniref:RHG29-like protein n=1 Tax=Mya arenaria TaxID=6604 RepID=A0ABY7FL30_MYAAR|nr:RHG29-like protein [Mya arenaria]